VSLAVGRRIGRWILLGAGALLFPVFLLSGDQGLMRYSRMKGYQGELAGRIQALRAGNAVLSEEVRRLGGDPAVIEGLARTQLQMVRPGEVVYLLPGETRDGGR